MNRLMEWTCNDREIEARLEGVFPSTGRGTMPSLAASTSGSLQPLQQGSQTISNGEFEALLEENEGKIREREIILCIKKEVESGYIIPHKASF